MRRASCRSLSQPGLCCRASCQQSMKLHNPCTASLLQWEEELCALSKCTACLNVPAAPCCRELILKHHKCPPQKDLPFSDQTCFIEWFMKRSNSYLNYTQLKSTVGGGGSCWCSLLCKPQQWLGSECEAQARSCAASTGPAAPVGSLVQSRH